MKKGCMAVTSMSECMILQDECLGRKETAILLKAAGFLGRSFLEQENIIALFCETGQV